MYSVLQFKFPRVADSERLEEDMALAIFAAECLYGRPRLRMEASYLIDDSGNACVMSICGSAGKAAACIFAGLAAARFGEDSFSVRRVGAE
jgi:hypothetical protein